MSVAKFTNIAETKQNELDDRFNKALFKVRDIISNINKLESNDKTLGAIERLKVVQELRYVISDVEMDFFEMIKGMFNHEKEGQTKYQYGKYNVEIRTPVSYKLKLKEYKANGSTIPESLNFVKIKTEEKYIVDKDKIKEIREKGSEEDIKLIEDFYTRKPGQCAVVLTSRNKF